MGRILLLMGERLCFSFGGWGWEVLAGRGWGRGSGLMLMVRGGGMFWVFDASEAVAVRSLRLVSSSVMDKSRTKASIDNATNKVSFQVV